MRKYLLLVALVLEILALTACDKDNSKDKQPEIVEKVFEPIVEESIENYKEEKLDLEKYSVRNELDIDANTGFLWFTMAESDYGYYIPYDDMLVFVDKVTEKIVPLCNRADCSHNDENCNAHYNTHYSITNDESDVVFKLNYLQFYDGYLYTLAYDMSGYVYLYKISEDGSTREKCMKLYKQEASVSDGIKIGEVCIHRGYVYYVHAFEDNPKLRRMRLGGGEEEIIFELKGERGNLYRIRPYGDFVFFQAGNFTDETCTDINSGIFAFNVNDGKLQLVKENGVATYFVEKDILYYQTAGVISRYDLVTGEKEVLFEDDLNADFSVDDRYIYHINGNCLDIYDLSMEKMFSVENSPEQRIFSYDFGNGEYLFAEGIMGDGDEQKSGFYYLKKTGIEDGTAKWIFSE